MTSIKCEKCGNTEFIIDYERGFELDDSTSIHPIMLDKTTNLTFTKKKTFMKCSKCGWKFPKEVNNQTEKVTVSFYLKNNEKRTPRIK